MPYVSQLAFYDVGLTNWVDTAETSQDSQRVIYEDPLVETLQLRAAEKEREKDENIVSNEAESKIDLLCHSPPLSSTPSPPCVDTSVVLYSIVLYSHV